MMDPMAASYVNFGSTNRFYPGESIHREKKAWGEEQWIVNKEYCGKKLILRKNMRCSMHTHAKKDEVFYLQSGKVLLEIGGETHTMKKGDFVHVQTGLPHRFTGLEDSEIIEFSTTHDESDSERTEYSGHVEQDRYDRQSALIGAFAKTSVLVVGDVMVDTYLFGSVDRVSPEAPIPVVRYRTERSVPGGAANAAMNAASLGAKATVIGVTGSDAGAGELERLLKRGNVTPVLIKDTSRSTTRKNRILSESGQQIVRLDYEQTEQVSAAVSKKLLAQVQKLLPKHSALLLSDYAKGVFSPAVLQKCIAMAKKKGIPVIVDPKPADSSGIKALRGATVITPNRKEGQILAQTATKDADVIGSALARGIQGNVLLTLGAEGMLLIEKNRKKTAFAAVTREVADVSGAGDTVSTVLALVLGAGGSLKDGADIANRAAGIVVAKQGTASASRDELLRAL
ncbi:cupin domain-containing protein [Candidatus Peribacteria bacterium]|nr:cupin domain-containing protein [Candidatus Peribacteria bacterium]